MTVKKISPVQMVAPKGDDELAVRMRLRVLLQLALAIGRRKGLLSNGNGTTEDNLTNEKESREITINESVYK